MSEHISGPRRGRPRREVVYERLDVQIAELWQRLGGLPRPVEAQDIWRGLWYEEAHHSTAIEGNTLVLRQVEALLEQGRAVGNKELAEYMEVKGYADAADWVYNQAIRPTMTSGIEVITLAELRRVHQMAMTPVWDVSPHPQTGPNEQPGAFREHDIQPFPGGMTPPSWPLVAAEIDIWLTRANALEPAQTRSQKGSPTSTPRSSASIRSSTATAALADLCSTWCSYDSATRRQSSTSASARSI